MSSWAATRRASSAASSEQQLFLNSEYAVGDVVQPHPDADDLVALLVQQRRGHRRIDAAGHRDEDPAHADDALAQRIGRDGRRRRRASTRCTRGTTAAAVSISASVVVRPSDRRSAPRASSSG